MSSKCQPSKDRKLKTPVKNTSPSQSAPLPAPQGRHLSPPATLACQIAPLGGVLSPYDPRMHLGPEQATTGNNMRMPLPAVRGAVDSVPALEDG